MVIGDLSCSNYRLIALWRGC